MKTLDWIKLIGAWALTIFTFLFPPVMVWVVAWGTAAGLPEVSPLVIYGIAGIATIPGLYFGLVFSSAVAGLCLFFLAPDSFKRPKNRF